MWGLPSMSVHFYPRSPCGERHAAVHVQCRGHGISIHAPLAESDTNGDGCRDRQRYFYPRSPCGERPRGSAALWALSPFLSTLPLRRATRAYTLYGGIRANFYPRSPCGERLHIFYGGAQNGCISIHAPLAESDPLRVVLVRRLYRISIHAPLAESDRQTLRLLQGFAISIHAPLAESDQGRADCPRTGRYFYPRSPCGERHTDVGIPNANTDISIHAPLAESDGIPSGGSGGADAFLSTLPLRRATNGESVDMYKISISIHAPLAESDGFYADMMALTADFYPRSPCGERRSSRIISSSIKAYFYPRSPCGERPFVSDSLPPLKQFLSTLPLRRATI